MKYVLMYTNRPDLDAAVPAERQQEVYQAIYGWFEKHQSVVGITYKGASYRHGPTDLKVTAPDHPIGSHSGSLLQKS